MPDLEAVCGNIASLERRHYGVYILHKINLRVYTIDQKFGVKFVNVF